MARITVEDCIDKFPSRFELVLIASNRARKLHAGDSPTVEIDNDKNTVIALREIAQETLTIDQLRNDLITEYQTNTFSEDEDINEIEDNSDDSQSTNNESEDYEKNSVNDYDNQSNDNKILQDQPIETSKDNLDASLDSEKEQDS